jgi:hypothetical protein
MFNMCIPSYSTIGLFLIFTLITVLFLLDTALSIRVLSKKAISIKYYILTFLVVASSWILSVGYIMLLEKILGRNYEFIRYTGFFVIPILIFFIIRIFLFRKLLKSMYLKSIIISILSLIVFFSFFLFASQIINDRYNMYCYNDVVLPNVEY